MDDNVERLIPDVPDDPTGIVDGDAATYLEALGAGESASVDAAGPAEGFPIELIGQNVRLRGSVDIGSYRRLSDYVNNHEGLLWLGDVTILRRNGDPTNLTRQGAWVGLADVTLIGESGEASQGERSWDWRHRAVRALIVVTPSHTLTGTVHYNPEATLAGFIKSPEPPWIPMTDVQTRSLVDHRVISHHEFALLNKRHIVVATELHPE